MFEQSLQTEEWKDEQAAEDRTPGEILALRIAAVLIAVNAILSFTLAALSKSRSLPLVSLVIGLMLAWYLYKLRPRAENLAIGIALISATLLPALYFWRFPFVPALLQSVATGGVAGSLRLLLIGRPGPARRWAAIALFVVLAGGLYALAFVGLYTRHY
jgi:hypothetical protein